MESVRLKTEAWFMGWVVKLFYPILRQIIRLVSFLRAPNRKLAVVLMMIGGHFILDTTHFLPWSILDPGLYNNPEACRFVQVVAGWTVLGTGMALLAPVHHRRHHFIDWGTAWFVCVGLATVAIDYYLISTLSFVPH